jgi:hypothetical protein
MVPEEGIEPSQGIEPHGILSLLQAKTAIGSAGDPASVKALLFHGAQVNAKEKVHGAVTWISSRRCSPTRRIPM